jgi:hypothetical protein
LAIAAFALSGIEADTAGNKLSRSNAGITALEI